MATLFDLFRICGQKSISQMTDFEALEHIKVIRASRRQTKAYDLKTTERTKKNLIHRESSELSKILRTLSSEQMKSLLENLEASDD